MLGNPASGLSRFPRVRPPERIAPGMYGKFTFFEIGGLNKKETFSVGLSVFSRRQKRINIILSQIFPVHMLKKHVLYQENTDDC